MSHIALRKFGAAFALLVTSSVALGQNVAGVFPPGFGPDHQSAQYRVAFEPDLDLTAHRVHFQKSIDRERMWRILGVARETDGRNLDVDAIAAELFWTVTEAGDPWQHGVRFDAIWRSEGRPQSLAVNWSSQYSGIDGWRFRGNLLSSVQVGSGKQSGLFLQSRAQVMYALDQNRSIGIEHYGVYGSSADLRDFKEQGHQLGPYIDLPLAENWRLMGSVLFGLTDATQDANFKLWITRQQ